MSLTETKLQIIFVEPIKFRENVGSLKNNDPNEKLPRVGIIFVFFEVMFCERNGVI